MTGQQDVTMSRALVIQLNTSQNEATRPDDHQPTVPEGTQLLQDTDRPATSTWAKIMTILLWRLRRNTPPPSEDITAENPLRKSIIRKMHECKEGYPQLAAFLADDENLWVYRRFAYVQSRLILKKQDELRKLEENLDSLDGGESLLSDLDTWATLERKFNEYVTLLTKSRELAMFNSASYADCDELSEFFERKDPVSLPEIYFRHEKDIVSLRTGDKETWLDITFWNMLRNSKSGAWHRLLLHFFATSSRSDQSDPEGVVLSWSRSRIASFKLRVLCIIMFALLVGPVYLLWHLTEQNYSPTVVIITVVLVVTSLMALVLSQFTAIKRHELMACTGAYCAVLVLLVDFTREDKLQRH